MASRVLWRGVAHSRRTTTLPVPSATHILSLSIQTALHSKPPSFGEGETQSPPIIDVFSEKQEVGGHNPYLLPACLAVPSHPSPPDDVDDSSMYTLLACFRRPQLTQTPTPRPAFHRRNPRPFHPHIPTHSSLTHSLCLHTWF